MILNTGPDGKLWAGYMNGEVAVIDGTSVRRYSVKDGLNIGPVAAILSGRSDCWLAGVNGLVRFDGQRFQVLSDANTALLRNHRNCASEERRSLAQHMGGSKACQGGRTPGSGKESRLRGPFRSLRPDGWLAECSTAHPALSDRGFGL